MKFSPCGWYCFDEPSGWIAVDTTESILLSHPPSSAVMEVTSARNDHKVRETEVWNLLEKGMLSIPGAPFEETSMYRLPSGAECLKSIQTNHTLALGKAYVFWSNYCVVVSLKVKTEAYRIDDCIQGFYTLLDSLQPLTTD